MSPRLLAFLAALPLLAQDGEAFKLEVTASLWRLGVSGDARSGPIPLDLESDLGLGSGRSQFAGRLVVQPARRHKLIVEGIPYRLSGDNLVSRRFEFAGRTFSVQEQIVSATELTYVFGGYQFDVLSSERGHLGFFGGGAYVDASGQIENPRTGLRASESVRAPLPLAGVSGRVFPVPNSTRLTVEGDLAGMSFGRYGHFIQAQVNAGVRVGPVTFLAGYRLLDLEATDDDDVALRPRFQGPVFSVRLTVR